MWLKEDVVVSKLVHFPDSDLVFISFISKCLSANANKNLNRKCLKNVGQIGSEPNLTWEMFLILEMPTGNAFQVQFMGQLRLIVR